jgi:hypothetical protein
MDILIEGGENLRSTTDTRKLLGCSRETIIHLLKTGAEKNKRRRTEVWNMLLTPCLGILPGVVGACCGHGLNQGFVTFKNGMTLYGYLRLHGTKPIWL